MKWDVLCAGMELAFGTEPGEITIVFSGGEPLLEFGLLRQAVEYAEQTGRQHKRLRYKLCTNGLLMSGATADFLDKYQFKIQLSFDGVSPAQDYRGEGTFSILDRVLDLLRFGHPDLFRERLRIPMTVIPATLRYLPDSLAYLLGKGVREIGISPGMLHYPGWCRETVDELEEQIGKLADLSRRHLEQTGEVPVTMFRKGREQGTGKSTGLPPCNAFARRVLALDVDGQLYSCPMFARSYQTFPPGSRMAALSSFGMGDVRDPESAMRFAMPLETDRDPSSGAFPEGRHSFYGKCRECEYAGRCLICPVTMWHAPAAAEPHRVPDFICAFNRAVMKSRDRFPVMPAQGRSSDTTDYDPIMRLEQVLRAHQSM